MKKVYAALALIVLIIVIGISEKRAACRTADSVLELISAAESALKSLSYVIIKNHLDTCVTDEILSGNTGITDEVMELFKKI